MFIIESKTLISRMYFKLTEKLNNSQPFLLLLFKSCVYLIDFKIFIIFLLIIYVLFIYLQHSHINIKNYKLNIKKQKNSNNIMNLCKYNIVFIFSFYLISY